MDEESSNDNISRERILIDTAEDLQMAIVGGLVAGFTVQIGIEQTPILGAISGLVLVLAALLPTASVKYLVKLSRSSDQSDMWIYATAVGGFFIIVSVIFLYYQVFVA